MRDLSFEPLTPTSFLRRSASVFTHRTAVVDGENTFSYAELWQRAQLLAGALRRIGVAAGERVAVLAMATHAKLDAASTYLRTLPMFHCQGWCLPWAVQPQPEWATLDPAQLAERTARQGVADVIAQPARVIDGNGNDVPADAVSTGEIAVRCNGVMLGYHRDPEATRTAAPDGWFRSGDVAVRHPDGYIQLVDRVKDGMISGGENVASVEVENVLQTHPAVLEAAVVSRPDPYWGEVPVAFVTLAAGIQKNVLRRRAAMDAGMAGTSSDDPRPRH